MYIPFLDTLYRWYGRRTVFIVLAVIAVLSIAVISLYAFNTIEEDPKDDLLPTVTTGMASSLGTESSIRLIGTVKAQSQAEIETESTGRITSVNVSLGDTVSAGQLIAQLENASQRAAVLQAEGSYESALAAAAQSDVSLDEAQNALTAAEDNALNAYRNAFNTVRGIILNNVDTLFTDPSGQIPGVRVGGAGYTSYLNNERVRFQSMLRDWQSQVQGAARTSDLEALLTQATTDTNALIDMIDVLLILVNQNNPGGTLSRSELAALSTTFASDRATLNATLASLDSALSSLDSAQEGIRRAEIGGTTSELSAANAQVKQALGTLRAAQANLEKTILRTPISGTVNGVFVDTGDFLGSFERVALVANNDALQITTYVGNSDRASLREGQAVHIEGEIDGVITDIAPAVDPDTRKVEVKIGTESTALANGDTVSISILDTDTTEEDSSLYIPITAVKFTETAGSVFRVENNVLVAQPVSIGEIRGSFVEIIEGVTPSDIIVIDARGRAAGQEVEPVRQ